MSAIPSEPPSPQRRRDLLALLGFLLVLSGIAILVLAVIMRVWVATAALALVVIGYKLVLISEYPETAKVNDSWPGGLKVRINEESDEPATHRAATPAPTKAGWTRRQPAKARTGCRLMYSLNERRGRRR